MSWGNWESGAVDPQHVFTRNVGKLIAFADMLGFGLSFGHAFRPFEEQEALFYGGNSKTLDSQHLHRLAVDFYVYLGGRLCMDIEAHRPLGEFWESLHPRNRWGSYGSGEEEFPDHVHLEMRN